MAILRITQHEALLVVADGGADHFLGNIEEGLIELADEHHRPLDKPDHLFEQRRVLDQLESLCECEIAGVGKDRLLALLAVGHHLGGVQLLLPIVEAAHLDWPYRKGAMTVRDVA